MRSFIDGLLKFLAREKKWWLIPLVIFVLLMGALIYFTQSRPPISPFMYTN